MTAAEWQTVASRTADPRLTTRLRNLYNASPEYATALLDLCDRFGCTVVDGPSNRCVHRLNRRTHHCMHGYDPTAIFGFLVDHPVWLRWPEGQWALLSQTYGAPVSGWLESLGAAHTLDTFVIGAAPYGYGTTGVIIVGSDRPHIAELVTA